MAFGVAAGFVAVFYEHEADARTGYAAVVAVRRGGYCCAGLFRAGRREDGRSAVLHIENFLYANCFNCKLFLCKLFLLGLFLVLRFGRLAEQGYGAVSAARACPFQGGNVPLVF